MRFDLKDPLPYLILATLAAAIAFAATMAHAEQTTAHIGGAEQPVLTIIDDGEQK